MTQDELIALCDKKIAGQSSQDITLSKENYELLKPFVHLILTEYSHREHYLYRGVPVFLEET